MKILQINTADAGGGAEGSAFNLFQAFRKLGHTSWLAVGFKYTQHPDVFEIPRIPPHTPLNSLLFALSQAAHSLEGRLPGMRKLSRILHRLGNPPQFKEWKAGLEETAFPGTRRLLTSLPAAPDIIHCHNLHGYYFDLTALPELSHRFPLILNLRDTWALTGHCAYFMDCPQWEKECSSCPHLEIYPPLHKDAAQANRRRKQELFNQSRLFVTAPSQWLLDQAEKSTLKSALATRVIPNGIPIEFFKPGDKLQAKANLNLPLDAPCLMFATASRKNIYKDPETLVRTLHILAEQAPTLHFLCVGTRLPELNSLPRLTSLNYISSPQKMAECYQAADLFLHTAKAEAFGKTVTEAMACGAFPIASAVGGLTEQIQDGVNGALGILPDELAAQTLRYLAKSSEERQNLSLNAVRRGAQFSLEIQARRFLEWYQEILCLCQTKR